MEELCIDGSQRRVVAWAKRIQDDLKIQLRVYRTNRNQTYSYSNYTASLHSLWVTYHCFPDSEAGCELGHLGFVRKCRSSFFSEMLPVPHIPTGEDFAYAYETVLWSYTMESHI